MTELAKLIEITPPSSNATLVPECGGNSNSLREMPAVITLVLVKVRPEYCVVIDVVSAKPSKSIVAAVQQIEHRPRITEPSKDEDRSTLSPDARAL